MPFYGAVDRLRRRRRAGPPASADDPPRHHLRHCRRRSRDRRDRRGARRLRQHLHGRASRHPRVGWRRTNAGVARDRLRLQVPGRHSVLNALAAVAVGLELGVPFDVLAGALADFQGAERRFERRGVVHGITVVDDYGHHPTEIAAVLDAARAAAPARVVVAFQPHRYTRTAQLMPEFAAALAPGRRSRAHRHLCRRRGADSRRRRRGSGRSRQPPPSAAGHRSCARSTAWRRPWPSLATPGRPRHHPGRRLDRRSGDRSCCASSSAGTAGRQRREPRPAVAVRQAVPPRAGEAGRAARAPSCAALTIAAKRRRPGRLGRARRPGVVIALVTESPALRVTHHHRARQRPPLARRGAGAARRSAWTGTSCRSTSRRGGPGSWRRRGSRPRWSAGCCPARSTSWSANGCRWASPGSAAISTWSISHGVVIDEYGPIYADLDLPVIDGLASPPQQRRAAGRRAAHGAGRPAARRRRRPRAAGVAALADRRPRRPRRGGAARRRHGDAAARRSRLRRAAAGLPRRRLGAQGAGRGNRHGRPAVRRADVRAADRRRRAGRSPRRGSCGGRTGGQ